MDLVTNPTVGAKVNTVATNPKVGVNVHTVSIALRQLRSTVIRSEDRVRGGPKYVMPACQEPLTLAPLTFSVQ